MFKQEKMQSIYNLFINSDIATTSDLGNCGFSSKEIKMLVDDGLVERVKRGYYRASYGLIHEILEEGKRLRLSNNLSLASKKLEVCYKLCPYDKEVNLLLFDVYISMQNYTEAYQLLRKFRENCEGETLKEVSFYLYLLSPYIKVKDEEISHIDSHDLPNFTSYTDPFDIALLDKLTYYIERKAYIKARKLIVPMIASQNDFFFEFQLIKKLINPMSNMQKNTLKKVQSFIKNNNYEDIVALLEIEKNNRGLSLTEQIALDLACEFLEISSNNKPPVIIDDNISNFWDAMNAKDYNLALKFNREYNQKKSRNGDDDVIYMLLVEINNLINSMSDEKVENITVEHKAYDSEINFSEVIQCLLRQDIDKCFENLNRYLSYIGKDEYEFLIANLIKICILKNDMEFIEPMMALTYISKDIFFFDVNSYVKSFYESISKKDLEIAKVYLDILSKANNIGVEFVATDLLTQVLNTSLEKQDHGKEDVEEKKNVLEVEVPIEKNDEEVIINEKQPLIVPKRDSEVEFIKSKYETLKREKGIILLKPMSEERKKRIIDIVYQFPDFKAFTIGENENKRIVLSYRPKRERINIREVIDEVNTLYKDKKYNNCIQKAKILLGFGRPFPYLYSKIGLCYLRLKKTKEALDYLIVGNELGKKENSKYDYSELINQIMYEVPEEDVKTHVKMSISDFEEDRNNYGIANLSLVLDTTNNSQVDIDEVCSNFGLSKEETNIVKIMTARHNYTYDNYGKGDEILKQVERSKDKNQLVKDMFNETIRTKPFYRNRKK